MTKPAPTLSIRSKPNRPSVKGHKEPIQSVSPFVYGVRSTTMYFAILFFFSYILDPGINYWNILFFPV